jgi:hypothetical protein
MKIYKEPGNTLTDEFKNAKIKDLEHDVKDRDFCINELIWIIKDIAFIVADNYTDDGFNIDTAEAMAERIWERCENIGDKLVKKLKEHHQEEFLLNQMPAQERRS